MALSQQPAGIPQGHYHLHLVSDASGETLASIAKAALVQYPQMQAIRHSHPFTRSRRQLDVTLAEIKAAPGLVLHTIITKELANVLEEGCRALNVPCVAALDPILAAIGGFIGAAQMPVIGGQHRIDPAYFSRMDAINFTLLHDDGLGLDGIHRADIVLVGVSRTSKTPTSIYLANRGYKTANVSLVPGVPPPHQLEGLTNPVVVGLVASAQRIAEVRRHRLLQHEGAAIGDYVDLETIQGEIAQTRRICAAHGWPVIDVTKRSIEETAAQVVKMLEDRRAAAATLA